MDMNALFITVQYNITEKAIERKRETMRKTIEKAIYQINRWAKKETKNNIDIVDFLYDAEERYECNSDDRRATCDEVINGLWLEAEKFVDIWKENEANGLN